MRLSLNQRLVLEGLLLDCPNSKAVEAAYGKDRERGTTRFGRRRTLNSLQRLGLIRFLYGKEQLEVALRNGKTIDTHGFATTVRGTLVTCTGPRYIHTYEGRLELEKLGVLMFASRENPDELPSETLMIEFTPREVRVIRELLDHQALAMGEDLIGLLLRSTNLLREPGAVAALADKLEKGEAGGLTDSVFDELNPSTES